MTIRQDDAVEGCSLDLLEGDDESSENDAVLRPKLSCHDHGTNRFLTTPRLRKNTRLAAQADVIHELEERRRRNRHSSSTLGLSTFGSSSKSLCVVGVVLACSLLSFVGMSSTKRLLDLGCPPLLLAWQQLVSMSFLLQTFIWFRQETIRDRCDED